jgi:hypothetical protein
MNSIVCTLFEGHYEIGLAAFLNSLSKSGFCGITAVGYRGALPRWALNCVDRQGYMEFRLSNQISVQFFKLETKNHFANCKAQFMLDLWQNSFCDADAMFYFDPDITIQCKWEFFEQWIRAGVALCADVGSDYSENHPLRHAWREYFSREGIELKVPQRTYFNSGFVGLERKNVAFLETWLHLQRLVWPAVGGPETWEVGDRTFLFHRPDQDPFNAATMLSEIPLSCMGRDAMGFEAGGYTMAHSIGPKPWKKNMLKLAILKGKFPLYSDKQFFANLDKPIKPIHPLKLFLKKLDLIAASALGRYLAKA